LAWVRALNALGEQKEKESMDKRLRQQRKDLPVPEVFSLMHLMPKKNKGMRNCPVEGTFSLVVTYNGSFHYKWIFLFLIEHVACV